jgi:hypothetical protein
MFKKVSLLAALAIIIEGCGSQISSTTSEGSEILAQTIPSQNPNIKIQSLLGLYTGVVKERSGSKECAVSVTQEADRLKFVIEKGNTKIESYLSMTELSSQLNNREKSWNFSYLPLFPRTLILVNLKWDHSGFTSVWGKRSTYSVGSFPTPFGAAEVNCESLLKAQEIF